MNVLFLGPDDSPISEILRAPDNFIIVTQDKELTKYTDAVHFDYLISHGYRHVIEPDILWRFRGCRAFNCHISLLPWNRGADPNLWSWIDGTPKGVSIHVIDEGLDTGRLVTQKPVRLSKDETLASSYQKLQEAMLGLFKDFWSDLMDGFIETSNQVGDGSSHRFSDRKSVEHLLTKGWDTPVKELRR